MSARVSVEVPPAADEGSYREVKRKAHVGERIKVVSAEMTAGKYKNGDILTVKDDDVFGVGGGVRTENDAVLVHDEYVVIENSAKPAPAFERGDKVRLLSGGGEYPLHGFKNGGVYEVSDPAYTDHDKANPTIVEISGGTDLAYKSGYARADQLEKADSTYKPGDRVRSKSTGKVHTLRARDRSLDDEGFGKAWRLEGTSTWLGENQFEKTRLTVGDYARVIGKPDEYHNFPVGTIVKIVRDDGSDVPYVVRDKNGDTEWIRAENVEPATEDDFKAQDRPKVGQYVPEGAVAKITDDDRDSIPFECVLLDGSDYDYYRVNEVEVISEDEAKEAAKWAAIGRKPGEYKVGDVVEVVDAGSSRYENGRAYEVKVASGGIMTLVDGGGIRPYISRKRVKLICPVEQRADLTYGGGDAS